MKISEIIRQAFVPRICLFCEEPIDYDQEIPICEDCLPDWLANLDMMCDECGFDSESCICLPEMVREINHSIAGFGVFYTPKLLTPVNQVVYMVKREYNIDAMRFCANIMYKTALRLCAKHGVKYNDFVVTFPPRRERAEIKYGYDHAKMLAQFFAEKMNLKVEEFFENTGIKEQKTLDRAGRAENAKRSYVLLDDIDVKGKNVFIIDDVMTSGSTLNRCARLLRKKGAKQIIPITFAKDMNFKNIF